jgi:hypothetical protein
LHVLPIARVIAGQVWIMQWFRLDVTHKSTWTIIIIQKTGIKNKTKDGLEKEMRTKGEKKELNIH